MKKHFFCLLLTLSAVSVSLAQSLPQLTYQGRVLDENGEVLPGVSVQLKGANKGTTTNVAGAFSLRLTERTGTLLVSFMGYETTELTLTNLTDFGDVVLAQATNRLNEVIVTGLGSKARLLSDTPGAVGVVTPRELENIPIVSVDRALQGKIAGVQVIGNSGVPGGGIDVRIRGIGSLNAVRQPLYIVDDVQISNYSPVLFASSSALSFLNINDIESITVLKDPAEAAIYGAQAANGVVLIRTKRGKPADRARVSLNVSTGATQVTRKFDLLTTPELAQLGYEAWTNRYGKDNAAFPLSSYYNQIDLDKVGVKSPADFGKLPTYDWQNEVLRTGTSQNYELTVSGGTDKSTYLLAGGYNTTNGPIIATGFKKYTLRFNFDQQMSKRLRVTTSLNGSFTNQKGVLDGTFLANPYYTALVIWPGNNPRKTDGSLNDQPLYGLFTNNPLLDAAYNTHTLLRRRLLGGVRGTYTISPRLYLSSAVNIDYTNAKESRIIDPRTSDGKSQNGFLRANDLEGINFQTDHSIHYERAKNGNQLNAQIGVQYISQRVIDLSSGGSNFPSPGLTNAASIGQIQTLSQNRFTARQASTFGKIAYTIADKYHLAVTTRIDGSSRLGVNRRVGFFPSVAGFWRLSNESFLAGSFVQNLKLRASYGTAGNNQLSQRTYDALGLFGTTGGIYDGQAAAAPLGLDAPNLGWETNQSLNIGLDAGFAQNRVTTSIDYFISRRKDLLLNRAVPATSGYATVAENAGILENRGLELTLSYQNDATAAVRWTSDFSATWLKNKLIALYGNLTELFISNTTRAGSNQQPAGWALLGQPINQVKNVRRWAGVSPADGRPLYYDTSDSVVYFPRSQPYLNRTADPAFFGSWSNSLGYKNIELRVLWYASAGNLIYNDLATYLSNSGSNASRNQFRNQLDRWQNPGDITDVPRPYWGGTQPGARANADENSDRFYEDGSYIRLREIILSYNLTQTVAKKIGATRARVYVAGTNLLTFTRYTGYDPELVGLDAGVYPQGKQLMGGVQLTF